MIKQNSNLVFFLLSLSCSIAAGIFVLTGTKQEDLRLLLSGGVVFITGLYIYLYSKRGRDASYLIITIYFLLLLPFFIAIALIGNNKKIWISDLNGDQILTIFTGVLSYFGTITLGIVAMFQNYQLKSTNDKLEASNEKYQRLSMAPYLSFLEVKNIIFSFCKQSIYEEYYQGKQTIEIPDKTITDTSQISYLTVEFTASNPSDYPITGLDIKFQMAKNAYTLKNGTICPLHIEALGSMRLCIAIGVDKETMHYWTNNDSQFTLKLYTKNVFQFTTLGEITVSRIKETTTSQYQIAQFSDMNPLNRVDKAED